MHDALIASARPDGHVQIDECRLREVSQRLFAAEGDLIAEETHRLRLIHAVTERGIYRRSHGTQSSLEGIGLRRAASAGEDYRRIEYSIGGAVREERSRSLRLRRSLRRLERQGRR